jgi:superfamily I DNA/RNA helicase
MKRTVGYIGQAGTGKTTALIKNLEEILESLEWSDHHVLLAITFMHGSRKRLSQKLQNISRKGKRIECQTIDSFSIFILNRYRRFVGINKQIIISPDDSESPFINDRSDSVIINLAYARDKVCELLSLKVVQDCIRNTYPIIVVDEFQDCEEKLLNIIQLLSNMNILLLAADHFQNLNSDSEDCLATAWLEKHAEIVHLGQIHRTTNSKILKSASALRGNSRVSNGSSIMIEAVPNFNIAAFKISAKIQWSKWGLNNSSIAIISPVNTGSSNFVKGCLVRLGKPFIKPNKYSLGPIFLKDDAKSDESFEDILKLAPMNSQSDTISISDLRDWESITHPIFKAAVKAAKKVCHLRGLLFLERYQFHELLSKYHHLHKTFRQTPRKENFIFTTIHGAKNREFDYVIILWPYESPGKSISKRKLLYNAITRARRDVLLLVQNRSSNDANLKKDQVFSLLI